MLTLGSSPAWQHSGQANTQWLVESVLASDAPRSVVAVQKLADGSFRYVVDGSPQTFVGMGYNPIYRNLPDSERAANYGRDFQILCRAGVNHITGWDTDKGYEQDKFDELTLDYAVQYGLGVVMPFYLPPEGNYEDEAFRQSLLSGAAAKVARFKDHPALRMWGVGNEVLTEMSSREERAAFGQFYLQLADLFHSLDPNHPVIYREAEDTFVSGISRVLRGNAPARPWLLYGTNVYTLGIERILDAWPSYELDRPLFVTEFGAEPDETGGRADGYVAMWQMIRGHPDYVLGGAPYAWTTAGPEPTDSIWGLMDANSRPVDDTFERLASEWRNENAPSACR